VTVIHGSRLCREANAELVGCERRGPGAGGDISNDSVYSPWGKVVLRREVTASSVFCHNGRAEGC
jgi:hypothetical protein